MFVHLNPCLILFNKRSAASFIMFLVWLKKLRQLGPHRHFGKETCPVIRVYLSNMIDFAWISLDQILNIDQFMMLFWHDERAKTMITFMKHCECLLTFWERSFRQWFFDIWTHCDFIIWETQMIRAPGLYRRITEEIIIWACSVKLQVYTDV